MKIKIHTLLLTPKIARKILEGNRQNRPVMQRTIDGYVVDLLAGRWSLNGETIKIADSGRLLDGQHRLLAIIKADKAVECTIAEGLDESVFDTIDTGVKRTAGQILQMAGTKRAFATASTAAWYIRIVDANQGRPYRNKISPAEILDTVATRPFLTPTIEKTTANFITAPVLGTIAAAGERYGFEKIGDFTLALVNGEGLKSGDPAFMLRERLIRNRAGFAKLEQRLIAAITVKAINSFLSGRAIGALKYGRDEEFPTFTGVAVQ